MNKIKWSGVVISIITIIVVAMVTFYPKPEIVNLELIGEERSNASYEVGETVSSTVRVNGGNHPYTVKCRGLQADWIAVEIDTEGNLTELGRIGNTITVRPSSPTSITFNQVVLFPTSSEDVDIVFQAESADGKESPVIRKFVTVK